MKPPATDARGGAPAAAAGGVGNVDRSNSLNQTLRKVTGYAMLLPHLTSPHLTAPILLSSGSARSVHIS
jgi:hypothetical protein